MSTSTLRHMLNKKIILMIFSVLCVFFSIERAFSVIHWGREYMLVSYNYEDNYIEMRIEAVDYIWGGRYLWRGRLTKCWFDYSTDGVYYDYLMYLETPRQSQTGWTYVNMQNKKTGTDIRFYKCIKPASGTMWPDNTNQRVEYDDEGNVAFVTIRWYVPRHLNVKYLRISGLWNGYKKTSDVDYDDDRDFFKEVYTLHQLPDDNVVTNSNVPRQLPKEDYLSESKALKVYSESDEVVIKYAELGDNIEIYNTIGKQVDARIANSDVIRVKLPANKMYVVKVGRERYMVAM